MERTRRLLDLPEGKLTKFTVPRGFAGRGVGHAKCSARSKPNEDAHTGGEVGGEGGDLRFVR
jgi:hypothetical protein